MSDPIPNYRFKTFTQLFPEKFSYNNPPPDKEKKRIQSPKVNKRNLQIKTENTSNNRIRSNTPCFSEIETQHSKAKSEYTKKNLLTQSSVSTSKRFLNSRTDCTTNSNFEQNLMEMEKNIGIVRENVYDKNKVLLKEKAEELAELQHRVSVLTTFIRLNRIQKKNYFKMTKGMEKETNRLTGTQEVK